LLKFGTILTANAQTYTLPALEPGFYRTDLTFPILGYCLISDSIGSG
jgi:hypothetical protein